MQIEFTLSRLSFRLKENQVRLAKTDAARQTDYSDRRTTEFAEYVPNCVVFRTRARARSAFKARWFTPGGPSRPENIFANSVSCNQYELVS
jgi:hypothetical protein